MDDELRKLIEDASKNFNIDKVNELVSNIFMMLTVENKCTVAEYKFVLILLNHIHDLYMQKIEELKK